MVVKNVMQCANLGGTEQSALNQMIGLQRRGHTCRVISVHPLGKLAPLLESHDINAVGCSYEGKFGWRSHLELRRRIRNQPGEATLMTGPTLTGIMALKDRNRKRQVLAVHFHHEGVKPRWQWRLLYWLAMRKFKAVTFPSDFVRREAESIYPPLASVTKTVRNPIRMPSDVSQGQKEKARQSLGLPLDAPIVGNAGQLIERKRFDVFLKTAQQIIEVHPRTIFLIAGDGPKRGDWERLAEQLGISDSVHWLGWKEELGNFYQSLDVLLFNSDWDALGMTPVEAMSFATPVVASVQNGGLDEIISSPTVGHLFQEHDPSVLAQTVSRLVADPEEATSLGQTGRSHVAELCSMSRCARTLEGLFLG